MAVVQKLAPKIQEAMGAEGVLIQQFNGAAAGQTVFHLHVHIIPRKEGEALKPHAGKMEDQANSLPRPRRSARNWRANRGYFVPRGTLGTRLAPTVLGTGRARLA